MFDTTETGGVTASVGPACPLRVGEQIPDRRQIRSHRPVHLREDPVPLRGGQRVDMFARRAQIERCPGLDRTVDGGAAGRVHGLIPGHDGLEASEEAVVDGIDHRREPFCGRAPSNLGAMP